MDDKVRANRQPKGDMVPCAVLTAEKVRIIRQQVPNGISRKVLAETMGVSPGTIGDVYRRRSWKHI